MEKLRKIRLDFEDHQDLIFKSFDLYKTNIKANSNLIKEKRNILIELALAKHASSYGLLGATFFPSKDMENELCVEIRFSSHRIPYRESLSNERGASYWGLEKEYAQSILTSVKDYFDNTKVPAGKLIFDTAAQCEIGSSIKVFSWITKILLDILLNEYRDIREDKIKDICHMRIE